MVAMPQWTDQPTNAKYVEDFWRVGVRARAREGFIDDFEIERCVQEVMEGERSGEMRENARGWKAAVEAAVREGGSSDQGLEEFAEGGGRGCGERGREFGSGVGGVCRVFEWGMCGGSDNLAN
ncbi:uncharacterized protein A4U43_C07F34910 [Asparagus officinalis]|uniref:Uncharacterized protein n=1 Tax=Asparagus officinalis TaxID=4686 RepID=A0A5P1EME9_ASPOF|nr:uncharacterized protein A4U43_C07F34910 [Asparagus officinalis]